MKTTKKTTKAIEQVPQLKFYDEAQTRDIRTQLERYVLSWPGVSSRPMMGCLCYFNGKKFFAFLLTKAIVITRLPKPARADLSEKHGGRPFEMSGKTVKVWVRVPLTNPASVGTILPYVRQSYESTTA